MFLLKKNNSGQESFIKCFSQTPHSSNPQNQCKDRPLVAHCEMKMLTKACKTQVTIGKISFVFLVKLFFLNQDAGCCTLILQNITYKCHNTILLFHQRHHHASQGRRQGLLGEHAKPDIPFEEGVRAEASGDLLQRGHAQVSGQR